MSEEDLSPPQKRDFSWTLAVFFNRYKQHYLEPIKTVGIEPPCMTLHDGQLVGIYAPNRTDTPMKVVAMRFKRQM